MDRFIRIIVLGGLMIVFEEFSDIAYEKGDISNGIGLFGFAFLFGYLLYSSAYKDGKKDAKMR